MRSYFLAVAMLALPVFVFAQGDPIVSGENAYVLARLNGAASSIVAGTYTDGSPALLQVYVTVDGSVEIMKEGDRNPLLTETELPGRRKLVGPNNRLDIYFASGVFYFIAHDPTLTVGPNKIAYVMSKTVGGDVRTLLASGNTSFKGYDPRNNNAEGDFTWLQTSILHVSTSGRVTAYGLATPPTLPGYPNPIPQAVVVQLGNDGKWNMVFNNQLQTSEQSRMSAIVGLCLTGTNTLNLLGRSADASREIQASFFSVFRVVSREIQRARPYSAVFGPGIGCVENSVQTYGLETDANVVKNFSYASIQDSTPAGGTATSSAEQAFFKGLVADTVLLDTRDIPLATGLNEAYVVMANGSLMRMGSQPKLIKSPSQAPTGNVQQVVKVGSQIVFLLNGRAYYVYQPLPQSPVSGRAGDTITITCRDCTPAGRVPSFQLRVGGIDVPYGVSSEGNITLTLPQSTPTGTYEATLNIAGLIRTVVVNVRPRAEPATPVITGVATPSGSTGPFAPRSVVVVSFSGDNARKESAPTDTAAYTLGDVSATLDGEPIRLLGKSGNGMLSLMIPASAASKSQGNLVLRVTGGGVTVESAPFRLNLAAVSNSLYVFDIGLGAAIPMLTGDGADGLLGSWANPLATNAKIRAYGTGCGVPPGTADDANVPEPGVDLGEANLQLGSDTLPAKATAAPLIPGLCYYDFSIPQGATSGRQSLGFVGSTESFSVWVK